MKATKNDETLANSIKQSTQQKGEGGRSNKERGPKSEPEEQNPKGVRKGGQRNKCFKRKCPTGFGILCVFSASTPPIDQEHHWS
jgi:hypothetical protein